MEKKQRINAFVKVGEFLDRHFMPEKRLKTEQILHDGLDQLIETAFIYNGWFIREFVEESLKNISLMLQENELISFSKQLSNSPKSKTIALIMAGNVPLVGFHDLLCVLLSGNKALLKLSSDDNVLFPFMIKLLSHYEPMMSTQIQFANGKLINFDAVIATGSTNTSKHFEHYFNKYPNIIRKNRTSIAVLSGEETEDDLKNLGKDIFFYFGLGCRNVSKVMVPKGYSFNKLFESILDYQFVIQNKKYGNNYDYNRTIYLLNSDTFLDNNFLIIKQDFGLFSPVAVLYYQEYDNTKELEEYLINNSANIQCVIGSLANQIPFGYSQRPVITDFADAVNTLEFLVNL